jgi:CTP synthase (UTP-ammonia lyase)
MTGGGCAFLGGEMPSIRIAIIGDYNPVVTAHIANAPALALTAKASNVVVKAEWIHTSTLTRKDEVDSLIDYQGIWCVPGSPYASSEGAISAISFARMEGVPFLGTCAGFQHALIEYFRNVIRIPNVAHGELDPGAEHPLISRLPCSLVEAIGTIHLMPGSLSQTVYGADRVEEGYRCNYGLNPEFARLLGERKDLRIDGRN